MESVTIIVTVFPSVLLVITEPAGSATLESPERIVASDCISQLVGAGLEVGDELGLVLGLVLGKPDGCGVDVGGSVGDANGGSDREPGGAGSMHTPTLATAPIPAN